MADTLHALLVEDSEADAELLLRLLRGGGYHVEGRRVETPEKLAEALNERKWDIVFADYTMPRFDGLRALAELPCVPTALLLDAFPLPDDDREQRAIVRGDQISLSIAAASIIAKVARDALMVELDVDFPGYGFARHKGYAAPSHLAAIEQLGACVARAGEKGVLVAPHVDEDEVARATRFLEQVDAYGAIGAGRARTIGGQRGCRRGSSAGRDFHIRHQEIGGIGKHRQSRLCGRRTSQQQQSTQQSQAHHDRHGDYTA